MNESVLITGGCGFAGSHLAIRLKEEFPHCRIVALDNLRRRGSELNLSRLRSAGVVFVHGDVRNREDFENVGDFSVLIDAAAEPSVQSGLAGSPGYVLNTNLGGTINSLEQVRRQKAKLIFLSTSRIYPIEPLKRINLKETSARFEIQEEQSLQGVSRKGISENFPLMGARSFYGASKLSSELLIQEYAQFYDTPAVINRCGVLTGPWQMGKVDQGFVVLWMARHFWKKELSYLGFGGSGKQVRDILDIEDLFALVKMQLLDFDRFASNTFNIGGGLENSVSLRELTEYCSAITGHSIPVTAAKEVRPADIPLYYSDTGRIEEFGWSKKIEVEKILKGIFNWIRNNEKELKAILE